MYRFLALSAWLSSLVECISWLLFASIGLLQYNLPDYKLS